MWSPMRDRVEGDVLDVPVGAPVGRRRHAVGQRLQHRRGAADGVVLERLAAREHQHHERAGQVLAEQRPR